MTSRRITGARPACAARSGALWLAALCALPASAAWAQAARPAPAPVSSALSSGSLFQALFGLIAVLGLMAGAAWLLKRFHAAGRGGADAVRIVGGVAVGSRERVMVVEVADQWIVVGVAQGSVNALATMPRREGAPAAPAAPKDFSSWLRQKIEQRNAPQ